LIDRIAWLRGWRADVAAATFGALSAAALPPIYAIPVLLLTVPALLALIDSSVNWKVAARRGFWFGFGHHLFGLYWITEAILIEAARFWWLVPLAVPALSALLALFIAVPCALSRAVPAGWRRAFLLAGLWVLSDIARQYIATGFPWNLWGSVWAMPGLAGDVMMQPAAWIGVPGMTLATLLLAATPAIGARAMAAGAAALVLWMGFGLYRIGRPLPAAPGIEAVLVQGNVAQGAKWDRDVARDVFERHLDLTRVGVAQAVQTQPGELVVTIWPESSSPYLLDRDAGARAAIWEASRPAVAAIVGSVRFDSDGRPRNSMFVLTGAGPAVAIYDKWHLVPFGEFAPTWVPVAVQVVPGGGFAFGPGPATLHVPGLPPFGGLICYEAIYPAQIVDERDRPAWLVNITNDAWFGNSTGPRQHMANARLRAVEEGLPLLRAANTGITVAFDSRGHELARLDRNVAAELVVEVPGAGPPTPFSRWGLVIPALLSFATIGLALGVVRKRTAGHQVKR